MISSSSLIETHTLAACLSTGVRVVETGQTRQNFDAGHIEGSVFWPLNELFTPDFRLQSDPRRFGELLSRSGITPDTLVVCSFGGGAEMAGWAPWLLWILTGFGHPKVAVLNGGTAKWRAEGRVTALETKIEPTAYPLPAAFDAAVRADLNRVRDASRLQDAALLDARSEREFRGEYFFDAPPQPNQRAGHIPGARHLPHTALLQPDGTYRPLGELQSLCRGMGLQRDRETLTYCAVGIRSALVWFVLKHQLGFPQVRNYDGSWNEWSQTQPAENPANAPRSEAQS